MRTSKQILASLAKWGTKGKAWVEEGQALGLEVLEHYQQHHDSRMLDALYLAMPRGTKSESLSEWILKFSGARANTGADKGEKPFKYVKDAVTDLNGARMTPWDSLGRKEKTPDEIFDFGAALRGLIAKAKKQEREGKFVYGAEALPDLNNLLVALPELPKGKEQRAATLAAAGYVAPAQGADAPM